MIHLSTTPSLEETFNLSQTRVSDVPNKHILIDQSHCMDEIICWPWPAYNTLNCFIFLWFSGGTQFSCQRTKIALFPISCVTFRGKQRIEAVSVRRKSHNFHLVCSRRYAVEISHKLKLISISVWPNSQHSYHIQKMIRIWIWEQDNGTISLQGSSLLYSSENSSPALFYSKNPVST